MKRVPFDVLLVALLTLVGVLFGWMTAARAQDGHVHGHAQYHEAYKNWCQPGFPDCDKVHSCCDARMVEWNAEGKATKVAGHCYPTEFRPNPNRKTDWIARLAPEDVPIFGVEWIEVPDHRVTRERNPDQTGQAGHLCTNYYTKDILCAVPPTGSM